MGYYGEKMNEVLQLSIKESLMRGLFFAMVSSNNYSNNYNTNYASMVLSIVQ